MAFGARLPEEPWSPEDGLDAFRDPPLGPDDAGAGVAEGRLRVLGRLSAAMLQTWKEHPELKPLSAAFLKTAKKILAGISN